MFYFGLVMFSALILKSLVHPFSLLVSLGWLGFVLKRFISKSLDSCGNRLFENSVPRSCEVLPGIPYLNKKILLRGSAAVLADLLVIAYTCTEHVR